MCLIETISLNENKYVSFFQGTNGKYYTIELKDRENYEILNETILKYDIHFPIEWADDDNIYIHSNVESKVGPRYCNNCIEFGFYNGVCIGYCANCATLLDFTRGNGLLDICEEINEKTIAFDLENVKEENSMWNTYLKDVKKEEIGDIELSNDYEIYKDLPPLLPV